ncbi:hypothetical protein D3C79_895460 [compost metagenome]
MAQSGHGLTKFLVYMGAVWVDVEWGGLYWAGFSHLNVYWRWPQRWQGQLPQLRYVGAGFADDGLQGSPVQHQIKVSIRSVLVDPGLPKGTPAVINRVSPRLAMPWAWAISSAVEQISST